LAISHQGRSAETPLIDFFQKLVCPSLKKRCSEVTIYISILQEELAHEMMKKGLELAKPVAIVMKG